jgi:hypothetical protein
MINNISKELRSQFFKELEESEGISESDLELVDLDIGFSPVIPFKGGSPAEATETIGGNYIVHGEIPMTVDAETLKIMRYRYLSNRKNPFA